MFSIPFVLEKIRDLSLEQMTYLFQLASTFKKNSPLGDYSSLFQMKEHLKNRQPKGFISFFQEPSTRTKLSFHKAAKLLHLHEDHLLKDHSSYIKGEDLEQMFMNLSHLGYHLCAYRTPHARELSRLHHQPPLSLINAGDGDHEHPTQALSDLFTFFELKIFSSIPAMAPAIILTGDLLYSRVAHSLISLLPLWGIKIYLCCPDQHLLQELYLKETPKELFEFTSHIEHHIHQAHGIYLFRFQKERHPSSYLTERDYSQLFGLTHEKYETFSHALPIFHAGPANIGVEIDHKLFYSHHLYAHQQVHHGIFLRMALMESLLHSEESSSFHNIYPLQESLFDHAGFYSQQFFRS